MASYTNITNTLDFAVALNPSSAFPLDARTMFGSLAAAQAAAATAINAGGSESVYYYGQILTVFENDVATHYTIQGDNTLKEVGRATLGDNKTIVLNDSVLSLKDFGVQYYAYNNPDNIIASSESYSYPDSMPAGVDGAYVKVNGTWYKYSADAWAEHTGDAPHTSSYYVLTSGWKAGLEPKVVSLAGGEYALAWYEPSATTVEGLQSIISGLQTETEALTNRVSDVENKANANEQAINILNGDEITEGSVKKQVADAIAKIIADAPESFDTLKEISDWISTHAEDAATMNSNITANTTAIRALETLVGTLPEGCSATTVIGYIQEAINTKIADLGTAAYKNVEDFATAAQGAKADTAVQEVVAGETNGHIKVDGADVKVYEAVIASLTAAGVVIPDGSSITIDASGKISVLAVDKSKVTGLDQALTDTKEAAVNEANNYVDENAVLKTEVVAAGAAAATVDEASDTKVVSEKLLLSSLSWKTGM